MTVWRRSWNRRPGRPAASRSARRVPLQHRVGGVVTAPLARWPKVVLGLGVSEEIRALEHPRCRFDGRCVQRDDAVARLALAPPDVHELLDEIDVTPAQVLHFYGPHRRVCGNDRGAIHVFPFRAGCGGVKEPLPLLWRQCATDGALARSGKFFT